MGGTNGSWTGRDPQLRLLRSLAVTVVLGLLGYVVVSDPDPATVGTLIGALLILLGFEAGIRWPGPPKGGES
jgi:hypothetical protein